MDEDHSGNRHPRLLMQFAKQEKMPKLVSINQPQAENFNTSSETQRQYQYTRSKSPRAQQNPRLEVIRLERQLDVQRSEKVQLQGIIKELTIKSERLKEINEHLIARLKQLEKSYIQNRSELQKQNQDECRKLKNNVYSDIQSYIKSNIETLKNSLQGEKMNPKVQQKIQNFMEEMLQINSHSVELLKISRQRQNPGHLNFINQSSLRRDSIQKFNISNQSLQHTDKKSLGPGKTQYQTLLKHLSKQKSKREFTNSFYQGYRTSEKQRWRDVNEERNTSISKSMFRNQYSTTPHKRKKIFDRF